MLQMIHSIELERGDQLAIDSEPVLIPNRKLRVEASAHNAFL